MMLICKKFIFIQSPVRPTDESIRFETDQPPTKKEDAASKLISELNQTMASLKFTKNLTEKVDTYIYQSDKADLLDT